MAQGKLKVKTKVPSTKNQSKQKSKGLPVQRRGNAPIQPKKSKHLEANKLKKAITRDINEAFESDLRKKALEGKTTLVKKRQIDEKQK